MLKDKSPCCVNTVLIWFNNNSGGQFHVSSPAAEAIKASHSVSCFSSASRSGRQSEFSAERLFVAPSRRRCENRQLCRGGFCKLHKIVYNVN